MMDEVNVFNLTNERVNGGRFVGIIHRTPEGDVAVEEDFFSFFKLLLKLTCVCCLCSKSWSQRWFISCLSNKFIWC